MIHWHRDAVREAQEAAAFYRERQAGLELRFLDSLETALLKIERRPQLYRVIEANVRKCRLTHFPYGVIFRLQADCVEIISIMHLRKRPRSFSSSDAIE